MGPERRNPREGRCARRAAAVAAALLPLAACTSISWDAGGVRHHVGLVVVRTEERGGARIVDRWALGSDLDLTRDGAWAVGASATERVRAEDGGTLDPRSLAEAWLAFLGPREEPPPPVVHWGFLWVTEEDSPRAVVLERKTLGCVAAWDETARGFALGWSSSAALRAGALGDDAVLCAAQRPGSETQYRMWRLGPAIGEHRE